ncbi:TIGR01440 family protein [Bacillus sp. BRMEA1]|uniref:TIGR01440 family protein n=1 Tax=Neobacillus endophyticus TaxID=2738405 RepID=UPI00156769C3|nr:TIGR01440 family protein [Neobacillus endophyticus]NRD77190.1 TIGR01440 family protein [Neobacillus endophyticus]
MIHEWEKEWEAVLAEFKEQASLKPGQLLVVGCSTSEVAGERIGTAGTFDVAEMIFRGLEKLRADTGIHLAFQCCEHLNRAVVMERGTAIQRGYEEVSVVPVRTAGGAMATFSFEHLEDAAVVEFVKAEAGIDIGSTLIGMHLKHVAVPVRVKQKTVGSAYVTLAKTRPKLIGGARAVYERKKENTSCS